MKVNPQDRIEEILDIATNPSNFKKVFKTGKVISIKELLHSQKRDKFCRKLAKSLHKENDFRINHEGLLVKQVDILRNTYQVYVVPQGLVHRVLKIFYDNRGHQGILRTINKIKRRFWLRKMREQVNKHMNNCLTCCQHVNHRVKYESKHLPISHRPFDDVCVMLPGSGEDPKLQNTLKNASYREGRAAN